MTQVSCCAQRHALEFTVRRDAMPARYIGGEAAKTGGAVPAPETSDPSSPNRSRFHKRVLRGMFIVSTFLKCTVTNVICRSD